LKAELLHPFNGLVSGQPG